jgi:osmotically-inducible protein OsmY
MRQPWWVALSLAAGLSLAACSSMPAMTGSPEDQRIASEIQPKLREFSPLRVDVRNGMVYVSGVVSTAAQRDAAEKLIREVPGVTGVTNNVHVGPHAPTRP